MNMTIVVLCLLLIVCSCLLNVSLLRISIISITMICRLIVIVLFPLFLLVIIWSCFVGCYSFHICIHQAQSA